MMIENINSAVLILVFIVVCIIMYKYYVKQKRKRPFNEWVPILEGERNTQLVQMYSPPYLWTEPLTKEDAIIRFNQGTQTNVMIKRI
jgi:hypothetical protein